MRVLLALALGVTSVVVAASASATVYVPGQYKDGIYVRPHFLDFPGQTFGGPLLLPPDQKAAKAKEALGSTMMDRAPVPQKRPSLPTS
ncbi:MAG: hypothetical protein ACREJ5_10645 [Geminicoccaceae bacterium]